MAAKLRPPMMLPRSVSTEAAAWLKPAAGSFSGLLDGRLVRLTEFVDLKGEAAAVSDRKAPGDNPVLK